MAPPEDQSGGGSSPRSPALRRQTSCNSSGYTRDESPVQLERTLSCSSVTFSSPAALPAPSSASTSTTYHPAAVASSSCAGIPFAVPALGKQSSPASSSSSSSNIMSMSSCESFFRVDSGFDCSSYLDFEPAEPPTTRAPAVQAPMTAAAGYDPKRLPSSMFRTRSTNPAEWSVTSNESLFSIRLGDSSSADIGDLYYDTAGFPRFPSMGSSNTTSLRLTSVSEEATGGLCLREDCTRCSGAGAVRKSVRFAATTESVSSGSTHSSAAVCPSNADTEVQTASTAKTTPEMEAGWCLVGCCWPFLPTMWWPHCCARHCNCCDCRC